jgi:hypothetical protein
LKPRDRVRAIRTWFGAVLVTAAFVLVGSAEGADVRLTSSGGGTITFEVIVPPAKIIPAEGGRVRVLIDGYGTFSPPGAFELPGKTFRVAIPSDGVPRVAATIIEEENLGQLLLARVPAERLIKGENDVPVTEQYYPPDPWTEGGAPDLWVAGEPSFMGRERVLPIRVNPLIVGAGGARLVRKLSISVAISGRAGSAADLAPAAPLSGVWKRLYDDLLVNPGDVSRFRKPLVRVQGAPMAPQAVRRLKLRVPETGLYAIRADSLIAAGLSTGLSIGEIALKKIYFDDTAVDLERRVDVPILVVEDPTSAPGVFDGKDLLVFYALGIKDDSEALDPEAAYTDDNVVWLEEQVAGALMPPGQLTEQVSGVTTVTQSESVVKSRKDTFYMRNVSAGDTDFYFITGPNPREVALPFVLHTPASSGTFSLVARIKGNNRTGLTPTLTFSVRNSGGTHQVGSGMFSGMQTKTFEFTGSPVAWLADGQNELVITCATDYEYLLNDFTVTYERACRAFENMFELDLKPSADVQRVEISGFSVNHGALLEVTDPRAPSYEELSADDFAPDGSGFKLSLNIEAMAERRFIVLGDGAGKPLSVSRITPDAPSELRAEPGPYGVLVIYHRDFLQRAQQYADWHASQGYRILKADVEDVFDEFNGGLPSPYAIKRLVQYGFDHWGIEFVVLVGDGSNDHKRVFLGNPPDQRGSPPDYVPSYSYCVSVSGEYYDEVIASDKWYGFLEGSGTGASAGAFGSQGTGPPLGSRAAGPASGLPGALPASSPGPEGRAGVSEAAPFADPYPDVIIGRLPFGADNEARALLNKIRRFEEPTPNDSWRRRIVLVADDAWSGRGADYLYRSYEIQFESSTDSCRSDIESSLPGGFDARKLYLARWTDPIHPTKDESGPAVWDKSERAVRATFTPVLLDELNQGCLFFIFQGHANRSLLTSEGALGTYTRYNDLSSLTTTVPHVFMGFGCHLSEFALDMELNYATVDGVNGDCFSEQLLFKPGAGAVATYASDAYEYLSENAVLCDRVSQNFFRTPPSDSVEPRKEYTGAHWIFGEAIMKSEIEHIDETLYGADMTLRYHILGDPLVRIEPGPPLLRLEADWGQGYREVSPDSVKARNGTNLIKLRLTASDVVAIGRPSLQVNGEDWSDSMVVTPLTDADKTYARSYRADFDYTINPTDELLVFKIPGADGSEAGRLEIPIVTGMRVRYNDYLDVVPGSEVPPTGAFRVTLDFPAFISEEPTLSINGAQQNDVHFVADPQDSLRWEGVYQGTLQAGKCVFTVKTGKFSRDFVFNVTGNKLVVGTFSFPNPFRRETNIVYSLNLAVDAVKIDIYNVSGILIRSLDLPPDKRNAAIYPSPHSVVWDGRDLAGDRVANGTYIYVIHVERNGESVDLTGKSVKLE